MTTTTNLSSQATRMMRALLVIAMTINALIGTAADRADSTYASITSYDELVKSQDTTNYSSLIMQTAVANAEKILHALTIERETWELAIYPAASYSRQSGLAIGLMPMLTIENRRSEHPTVITPSVLVSTKKMWEVQCDADVYLPHRQTLTAKAEFMYQPDKFYGLASVYKGEKKAEYNIYRLQLSATYQKSLGTLFKIGPSIDFTNHNFRKVKTFAQTPTDSIAITGEIRAAKGWDNAIGLSVSLDSRDDHLSPRTGWFATVKALAYRKWLASDREFNSLTFDIRRYCPIGEKSTLAFQLYASGISSDEAPFHKMATYGGTRLGRAIPHNLMYADRYAGLLQSEFRFPLFWRIGATTWVGAGSAAHKMDSTFKDNMQGMGGLGLRFKVFPEKKLNMRLDVGLSTNGDKGVYFNLKEAF